MPLNNCKYRLSIPKHLLVFGLFTCIVSCSIKKTIPKNKYLLKSNTFEIANTNVLSLDVKSKIQELIIYKPNKKVIFGKIPLYLYLYTLGTKKRNPLLSDSIKWRRKLRNFGEPPVLFDSFKVLQNIRNIKTSLFNQSYFNGEVSYTYKTKKHKAYVTYTIDFKKAYVVSNVLVKSSDINIKKIILKALDSMNKVENILIPWKTNASIANLTKIRDELTSVIQKEGYYTFQNKFIQIELDTIALKKECSVTFLIDSPSINTNFYPKYSFGKTTLIIDVNNINTNLKRPISYTKHGKVLILNGFKINPITLARLIYTDSGKIYTPIAAELTYQSLVEMELFSLVEIKTSQDSINKQILTSIYCIGLRSLAVKWEPQGLYSPQGNIGTTINNSTQRSFGLAMLLSFSNRNLFGNGEKLTIGSITSAEAIFKSDINKKIQYGLQQGFNVSLTLPHFNLLNKATNWANFHTRKTVISTQYLIEDNPNFVRRTLPANLTFQFQKPGTTLQLTPFEISYLFSKTSDEFLKSLSKFDSIFASRVLFTPILITPIRVGSVFTNTHLPFRNLDLFFRSSFETSGNILRWVNAARDNVKKPDTTYSLFNIQFNRYVRGELEFRVKYDFDELNTIAFKFNSGISLPYGNGSKNSVPYDKRFFIGGSNSLRGWRPRRIGPGTTPSSSNIIDKAGELLIETSIEYRFTLLNNFLYGAMFMDAGNIWNVDHKYLPVGSKGVFNADNFINEMAFNSGFGARFDIKFFLFRLDWGWPMHDPSKAFGNRWMLPNIFNKKYITKETALTIGIGYPF